MSETTRANVGCYLGKSERKRRKIETPALESIQSAMNTPTRRRGRHWLSAAINRLRWERKTYYSKREV